MWPAYFFPSTNPYWPTNFVPDFITVLNLDVEVSDGVATTVVVTDRTRGA